ncbi:antitermination protein [Yersinia nurmii]|uniref:Antitermination protein n=1 Tax=Yersinia nurmii TaxID=685706 RepID=A0ABM9S110_9GAMM|nr:antitermination protein [Yersinia nurmii]CND88238.1 antitermination protein [Yersinia nurmii]
MNLESATKYLFCKSQSFTDSPRATGDILTGADVMGAFGLCQSKAELGFKAYSGKLGLSASDAKDAIQLLTQYGMTQCDKVAALRKLDGRVKVKVVQKLAGFAYQDYCRSASGVEECACCQGEGFVIDRVATAKDREKRVYSQPTQVICSPCRGKGVVSVACRDCRGRGVVVDQKESKKQGILVKRDCKRCRGRGYERIPASTAFRAVSSLTNAISAATWDKSIKPFYDSLIGQLEQEEVRASNLLRKAIK